MTNTGPGTVDLGLDRFTTPRLRAERLTERHWDALRRMDEDPGFMAFLGGVRGEAGTAVYLERNLAHWARYGFGLWMLHDREGDEVVGRAVLRHLEVEEVDEVEVGYGFLPAWWGRGLATEIARATVRLGLERLGLPSLVAVTRPENTGSRRVLERAGLQLEREVPIAGEGHLLFRIRGRPS